MARKTPCACTQDAVQIFDDVVGCLAAACNLFLTVRQEIRTKFNVKRGGLGLRGISDRADAACIASRALASHLLQNGSGDSSESPADWPCDRHLQHAASSLRSKLLSDVPLTGPFGEVTQRILNKTIDEANLKAWRADGTAAEATHLSACSTTGCGFEVDSHPSKTLDMHFSKLQRTREAHTGLSQQVVAIDIVDNHGPASEHFCPVPSC